MKGVRLAIPIFVIVVLGAAIADRGVVMANAISQVDELQSQVVHDEQSGLSHRHASSLVASLATEQHALALPILSPKWWITPAPHEVPKLQNTLEVAWNTSLGNARSKANQQIIALQHLWDENPTIMNDLLDVPKTSSWTEEMDSAKTPHAIDEYALQWQDKVASLTNTVSAAKTVLQVGLPKILSEAMILRATAHTDNLQSDHVGTLADQLKSDMAAGTNTLPTATQLEVVELQLTTTIALNNSLFTVDRNALWTLDQAEAEQIPGSTQESSRYSTLHAQYISATTTAQLQSLRSQYTSFDKSVESNLAAHACGHQGLPSGKVITVSLSLQEMVFYDNGCAVRATPVTTGRKYLRTPVGTYHIYNKITPYDFISMWPPGSPFWYPSTWVNWVMGFANGQVPASEGYYIHDAGWEPPMAFGPGGQNGPTASHGCVQTPTSTMQWAFSWTPVGTPVIVTQ
ncbi:MAG: L,D-transpeptidase [Candidatus Dormibacteria bacterium]